MKTTLDIPDAIFRRAKARAAERQVPLRRLVSDALAEKLEGECPARQKARTKLAGRLRRLRKETDRISKLIDRECERVEPQEWVWSSIRTVFPLSRTANLALSSA